jgi:hypothetical protein
MKDGRQPHYVEYLKYFGSMLTNDEKCTHQIKSRITTERKGRERERDR